MVAHAVLPAGLYEREGALHVGAQKRRRVGDGVVVVGLRGVVDHGVVAGDDALEQRPVADVAHHELDPPGVQPRDVLRVARVGELVEHGDMHLRVLARHPAHEVRPDEAAAAGDDDVFGLEDLRHSSHPSAFGSTPSLYTNYQPVAAERHMALHS